MIRKVAKSRCKGCCTCIEACTQDVLQFNDERQVAYIAKAVDCQTCFTCALNCPSGAIWVYPFYSGSKLTNWTGTSRSI